MVTHEEYEGKVPIRPYRIRKQEEKVMKLEKQLIDFKEQLEGVQSDIEVIETEIEKELKILNDMEKELEIDIEVTETELEKEEKILNDMEKELEKSEPKKESSKISSKALEVGDIVQCAPMYEREKGEKGKIIEVRVNDPFTAEINGKYGYRVQFIDEDGKLTPGKLWFPRKELTLLKG
jgi:hypothetical protein